MTKCEYQDLVARIKTLEQAHQEAKVRPFHTAQLCVNGDSSSNVWFVTEFNQPKRK